MRPDADAKVVDGEIVIRLSLEVMAVAAERSPGFEEHDEERETFRRPVVTDRAAFAKDLVRRLNQESEDGSTLITDMFDDGFKEAVEGGAEGIAFPGDPDYPSAPAKGGEA